MVLSNFGCTFSNLGDVFRFGMFEYQNYENRFMAHKPSKYTATYGGENQTLLQSFLNMDENQNHVKAIQAARTIYVGEVKGVNMLFKSLKNFISELTTDKVKLDNLFKDAGQQLFTDRGDNNLEDNDKLLNTMVSFVESNQAALLAKDLPANFIQQLKDKQASLAATNKAWLAEKEAGSAASNAKTLAGNELKARLSAMFAEAQIIFQEEKDIAKKFVWDTLLAKVRGSRDAGVGGKVSNKATGDVLEGVSVSIASLNLTVVTDANGRYELSPIPAGTYIVDVKAEGFKPLSIKDRIVKDSVVGRLAIELELL